MDIEPGHLWEIYSAAEKRWVRIVVAKIEDGRVRVRYQGLLEFFTVKLLDMQNKPELFRPAKGR
jgi:hypothetical protein